MLLVDRYDVGEVVRLRKPTFARTAPDDVLSEPNRCGAIVEALADLGSYVSCSLHDVVTLEMRGIPAVAVGTEAFRVDVKEQVAAHGMPDYRMLEVPHPIHPIPLDDLPGFADTVVDEVVARLTDGP